MVRPRPDDRNASPRGVTPRGGTAAPASTPARTISSCAQALLAWHGIDPLAIPPAGHAASASIVVEGVADDGGHLSVTISLPMPYGDARMTVRTGHDACIAFPGMALSPAMTAATIGRPIGRLAGHPAFDTLDHLRVTAVRQEEQAGRTTTILSFDDTADAIAGPYRGAALIQ